MAKGQVVIDGLDMLDIISWVGRKNRRYIADSLRELEDALGKDSEQYVAVRKIFLDKFNDYTRSILILLFGNIEGLF